MCALSSLTLISVLATVGPFGIEQIQLSYGAGKVNRQQMLLAKLPLKLDGDLFSIPHLWLYFLVAEVLFDVELLDQDHEDNRERRG